MLEKQSFFYQKVGWIFISLIGLLAIAGCASVSDFRPIKNGYGTISRSYYGGAGVSGQSELWFKDTQGKKHLVWDYLISFGKIIINDDIAVFEGRYVKDKNFEFDGFKGPLFESGLLCSDMGRIAKIITRDVLLIGCQKSALGKTVISKGISHWAFMIERESADGILMRYDVWTVDGTSQEISFEITWTEIEQLLAEAETNGGKLPAAK